MSFPDNLNYSLLQLHAKVNTLPSSLDPKQLKPKDLLVEIFGKIKTEEHVFTSSELLSTLKIITKLKAEHLFPIETINEMSMEILDKISKKNPLASKKVLSPPEIKAFLINEGILPSSEEAKKVFWSLGEDWWRQIIDGKHQKHGKLVFDQGLHGGKIEPGYLKGVEDGSHFFY